MPRTAAKTKKKSAANQNGSGSQPSITMRLPVSLDLGDRYMTDRLDLRLIGHQKFALRRLLDGLDAAGARLANGRRVTSPPDVIRYLLENVEAQVRNG